MPTPCHSLNMTVGIVEACNGQTHTMTHCDNPALHKFTGKHVPLLPSLHNSWAIVALTVYF